MKKPTGNLERAYNMGFRDGALKRDEKRIKKQTEQNINEADKQLDRIKQLYDKM